MPTPFPGNIIPQAAIESDLDRHRRSGSAAEFRRRRVRWPATSSTSPASSRTRIKATSVSIRIISSAQQLLRPFLDQCEFETGRRATSRVSSAAALPRSTTARRAVISDVHIFTPALVNEFRFGYVRHNGSIFGTGQDGVGFRRAKQRGAVPGAAARVSRASPSIIRASFPALRNSPAGAAAIPI